MEPTTFQHLRFWNHANERLRILGEIPVRKFDGAGDGQPLDPDGNPDTSFLAKIPADTAFTFQTLDRQGMVLNMAQTWHQVRPGEIRNDCGGCHAHSQKPTLFEDTAAARASYKVFDLTKHGPPPDGSCRRRGEAEMGCGRTNRAAICGAENCQRRVLPPHCADLSAELRRLPWEGSQVSRSETGAGR